MAVRDQIPYDYEYNALAIDIRDTLNYHGSSCTDELLSFFDSRAVINIWSFRKPYSFYENTSDLFLLTNAEIRAINCGLTPLQVASYTTLPDKMDGEMNGWVYTRPGGGSTDPYRLGDYAGYYPLARPMIQDFQVPAEINTQETTTVEITAICPFQDGKSVTIADLGGLSACVGAVYMKHNTQSQTRNIVGTSSLSGGTFNVSIPIDQFINGEWTLYPYITTGSTHYTIPNLSPQVTLVKTSAYTISMTAEKATDGTRTIYWTARFKNTSGEAVTLNTNYVYLRLANKELNDAILGGDGEKMIPLSDGLVAAANATTTVASGSFTNVSDKVWMMPKVWVTFNSGNYTGRAVPIEERTS